ncbi:MAG: cyanophycinase [Bacteroidota bacterium]
MICKTPKGKLITIGGAEDKGDEIINSQNITSKQIKRLEILNQLIPSSKQRGGIEIITTASSEPIEVNKIYKKAFNKIGFKKVGFMSIGNHPDSHNPIFIKRIKAAHAVLFSGGDQFRLSTILGNTDILEAVKDKYFNDPDFIVAGTSAGAMAATELMLYEAENHETLLKKNVKVSSGLGFLDGCIIDTHFTSRGRFGRLAQAIVMNPGCVGIGISENTALIIKKGNEAYCIGSGMVIIIDGRNVDHTNIAYADDDEAICIENLKVHILCEGNGYELQQRKFIADKKDIAREESAEIRILKEKKDKLKMVKSDKVANNLNVKKSKLV